MRILEKLPPTAENIAKHTAYRSPLTKWEADHITYVLRLAGNRWGIEMRCKGSEIMCEKV